MRLTKPLKTHDAPRNGFYDMQQLRPCLEAAGFLQPKSVACAPGWLQGDGEYRDLLVSNISSFLKNQSDSDPQNRNYKGSCSKSMKCNVPCTKQKYCGVFVCFFFPPCRENLDSTWSNISDARHWACEFMMRSGWR